MGVVKAYSEWYYVRYQGITVQGTRPGSAESLHPKAS